MYPYGTPRPHSPPLGPLSAPVSRATTHAAPDAETIRALGARDRHDDFYARYGHANARAFEAAVAALDGADGAVSFASGMAAIHAVLCGLASQGDRVLVAEQVYGGTLGLASRDLPRFGIDVEMFDALDPHALARALATPARVCIVESPVNPTLRIVDLERVARACRAHGVVSIVDSTFAPPPLQRPHLLGIDLVMHSATKFLGGHSDVLAGVVSGAHELLGPIEAFRARTGGVLGPDAAWLLCRSMPTLELRVHAQSRAAHRIAVDLAARAGPRGPIVAVRYPGLPDHPDRETVARQMTAGGALVTVELAGGLAAAMRAFDRFERIGRAPSLGGIETLASLPVHTTHAALSADERARREIAEGAIRLSIGLDRPEVILQDVLNAVGGQASVVD